MDLSNNYLKWQIYAEGKQVVTVTVDEYDVLNNSHVFSDHRKYIRKLFADKGLEVTRFGHEYNADGSVHKWGLIFLRGDSDIRSILVIKGIVGENISPIKDTT